MLRLPQRPAEALENFVRLLVRRAVSRLHVGAVDFKGDAPLCTHEELLRDPLRVDLQRLEDAFRRFQLRTESAQSLRRAVETLSRPSCDPTETDRRRNFAAADLRSSMTASLRALAEPDVPDQIRSAHIFVAAALLLDYGLRGDPETAVRGVVECLNKLCTTPAIAVHFATCTRLGDALELAPGGPAPLEATLTVLTDLRALVFFVDEFFLAVCRWCYRGFRFPVTVTPHMADPLEDLLHVAAFKETVKTVDHHSAVLCLAHSKTRLFSGMRDGAISAWDPQCSRCERRLLGGGGSVFSMAVDGDTLFSGSSKDIQLWDLTNMECVNTLCGHGDAVHCLLLADGHLFSGSADATIVMWDVTLFSAIGALAGHTKAVLAFAFKDGLLFSASTDTTIKVWDPRTRACLGTFTEHADRVKCLAVSSDLVFSGSDDATVRIWRIGDRSLACEGVLEGHRDVRALLVVGHHLFIGGHRMVQVWDLRTEQLGVPLCGHTETVCALSYWHGRLFSGGIDTTVRIWGDPHEIPHEMPTRSICSRASAQKTPRASPTSVARSRRESLAAGGRAQLGLAKRGSHVRGVDVEVRTRSTSQAVEHEFPSKPSRRGLAACPGLDPSTAARSQDTPRLDGPWGSARSPSLPAAKTRAYFHWMRTY